MNIYHVCHLTSAHSRYDTRIFEKQCRTLAKNNFKTTLIVADGKGNEIKHGVQIIDVGLLTGRINRILKTTKLIFKKSIEVDADIFHFHDPELLHIGLKLKKCNKKVIFDSHEDVTGDILVKPYLKPPFNYFISKIYSFIESYVCGRIDGVVCATPAIEKKFLKKSKKVVNINNYPILEEYTFKSDWLIKKNEVCYVGSLSKLRGCVEIVKAFNYTQSNVRLNLGGKFSDKSVEVEVKALNSFKNVNLLGYLDKEGVNQVYSTSKVGVITSFPIPTFKESLPIKMFEFMACGIPFIASDFPYWRKLLEGYECCIFVDPLNASEIAKAIDFYMENPKKAELMGERGRELVYKKYDWKFEAEKLVQFYNLILLA